MPAVPPRWCRLVRRPALIAAALTMGLAVVPATGGGTAAAAVARPASRYNVGATHSPQLLSQLAGTAGNRAMTGSGQASSLLAPAAAVAGDEQGVDVASFQHPETSQYPAGAPIDWAAVAASGIGFAAVKVTEGTYYSNPFAATDLAQAQAAGLAVVAYGFAIPNSTDGSSSPAAQADYLLNQLGTASRTVPVMLDVEYNPYAGGECYGLRGAPMVSWVAGFEAEIKAKTGRLPIIYTPPAWWNYCTGSSTTSGQTPLWVPDFSTTSNPARPAGWGTWSLWQYTSTGTVSGIAATGGTDLDQANPASLALLNPGSRPQTNGDPVNLPLSLAVPPPGQSLGYSATGLPPGLSISAAGLITGWVSRTGSYTTQVSVSGSGGAAGRATFSWTVARATNTGPAGAVRFDVAGRCLDLAGNATANGTKVGLWRCNGTAAQRWTLAADRTVRIHGKCLSVRGRPAVNGSKVVLGDCHGYASQHWVVGTGARLINGTAGKCLAGSPTGANGSQAWISSCTGKANQKWTLPAGPLRSQLPGWCAASTSGTPTSGTRVSLASCAGTSVQRWATGPDGALHLGGECLGVTSVSSGSAVALFPCRGSRTQHWQIQANGAGLRLRNAGTGGCLSDPGDATTSGTPLVQGACTAADPGAGWRLP